MDRLKGLRIEKGVTQREIAELLGVTYQAYSYYEKGSREPSHEAVLKLADYFNVTTDYLLGRETPQKPEERLEGVFLSLARDAQDSGIDPEDIRAAIEIFKKVKRERGEKAE